MLSVRQLAEGCQSVPHPDANAFAAKDMQCGGTVSTVLMGKTVPTTGPEKSTKNKHRLIIFWPTRRGAGSAPSLRASGWPILNQPLQHPSRPLMRWLCSHMQRLRSQSRRQDCLRCVGDDVSHHAPIVVCQSLKGTRQRSSKQARVRPHAHRVRSMLRLGMLRLQILDPGLEPAPLHSPHRALRSPLLALRVQHPPGRLHTTTQHAPSWARAIW